MKKPRNRPEAGPPISSEQNARLQQAMHAHSAGSVAAAEAAYRALINENVRSPDLYCKLAQICVRSARRDEANMLWEKALAIEPTSLEARMNLADSAQLAGDIERASAIYRQVIASHKDFYIARYMLANILKSKGKMDEASTLYRQVMAREPAYTQAHFSYAGIHKYKDRSDPHFDAMLDLYPRTGLGSANRIHLDFALAKAFEDIGDYSQAFRHLKSGNDARYAEFNYDIESDKALIESIIGAFSKEAISRLQVSAQTSNRPIFIVGMPRSGTSLVEKIIASHSDVHGAGELDYMFALGTSRFLGESNNYEFQALDAYAPGMFEAVGKDYLAMIGKLDDQAARVTDKMPFNMMMVGLIRIALPNAKIIHCVRDARDTCLSILKQNFTTGNYRFAYDMKTVAQFHNLYRQLMAHWHATMPGDIYDVSYESLTHHPEDEIRKLLAACDLEFQERCVDFSKSKAVVKTASAFQVRQPMYTKSVGLWREYEQFLGPMLEELQDS
jgi:tetratricopeptide (TPR) repeat protein